MAGTIYPAQAFSLFALVIGSKTSRMIKRKVYLSSIPLFFVAASICAHAGQFLQNPQSQNQQPSVDCSLPENADAPECSSDEDQNGMGTGNQNQPSNLNGVPPGQNPALGRTIPNAGIYRDNGGEAQQWNANQYLRYQTTRLPAQPLTEFQMLVAASVGRIVPIYGADLFLEIPRTFAPAQRIPVTPEYVIGAGDELLVRIWGQVNENLHLTVDREGSVYIPQVGEIRVAGLQFGQLQSFLKAQLSRVFRNFDANVNLGQLRSIQVFVTGQARKPGSYTVSSLSTLVNAVFACGGPAPNGSLRHILLKRGNAVVTDFDLYDLLLHGDKSKDAPLETGDVIYFPPLGPEVAVVGSVQNPAIYELRGSETISDGLALAGGLSAMADSTSLAIERSETQQANSRARITVDVDLNASGQATPLRNADLIRVRSRTPSFDLTVTLRGNVAEPGRLAWHKGMRVRDLIPDKEALLTKGYWLRREQLGLPVADFQPMLPPERRQSSETNQLAWPYETPENPSKARPQDFQTVDSNLFPQLTEGVPKEPGYNDQQTGQFSALAGSSPEQQPPEDQQVPYRGTAQSGSGSSTSGRQYPTYPYNPYEQRQKPEVLGSGPHLVTTPSFPIETQVVRTSPDIDWTYAVVERIDAKTLQPRLVPFNLGSVVLDHDESADIDLEPGDIITIFSDADIRVPRAQQTKYVRLEGEFVHSGVYSAQPGETLPELVTRAGGLTSQAYLYGSEFTRESARREQQRRLDEYVNSLAFQIEASNTNKASSVVNAQEAATASSSVASGRELINRLRQLRATGRVVLHLDPRATSIDSLPDLPLEDGDRFVVPPVPSTVGVIGAVYDPSSFVYRMRSHAADYLKTSGGPNRFADRHQIFIIRADGSVVSRQYVAHNLWSSDSFEHEPMYAGDTIVVPQAINRTTVLRGLTDWSAVFSSFALGAAAIQVIR